MAKIRNVGYKKFRKEVKDKKVVLWGTVLEDNNIQYPVISENDFLQRLNKNSELCWEISIFITPTCYAGEIIKHINRFSSYDSIDCYVGVLMRDYYEPSTCTFTEGTPKIPKKIHYCWFGGKEIPDSLKRYMETWHRFCPDYEIIRWDESNYDITKNRYMREAYECLKWGFVPDYARLDIIYNEGGVYLDTDVELVSSLDRLLNDEMFCGFSCNFQIAMGLGFGAIKEYQNPVFRRFGFELENRFQKKNGVVVYPSEVLSPDSGFFYKNYSANTIAVHHFESSWASESEKKAMNELKRELADKSIYIETR